MKWYDKTAEKLAMNQYERITKRKWRSASQADKTLWIDGAVNDLKSINVDGFTSSYCLMPARLDVDERSMHCFTGKALIGAMQEALGHHKHGGGQSVAGLYSVFYAILVDKFQERMGDQ